MIPSIASIKEKKKTTIAFYALENLFDIDDNFASKRRINLFLDF
jgi:hypothetical protein